MVVRPPWRGFRQQTQAAGHAEMHESWCEEQTAVTDDDVLPGTIPPDVGDPNSKLIIAPEVKSLQFQYFDGTALAGQLGRHAVGADGVTPLGPPAAVAITIGLARGDGGGSRRTATSSPS